MRIGFSVHMNPGFVNVTDPTHYKLNVTTIYMLTSMALSCIWVRPQYPCNTIKSSTIECRVSQTESIRRSRCIQKDRIIVTSYRRATSTNVIAWILKPPIQYSPSSISDTVYFCLFLIISRLKGLYVRIKWEEKKCCRGRSIKKKKKKLK